MNHSYYKIWTSLGYLGAMLNALGGMLLVIYSFSLYSRGEVGPTTLAYLVTAGASGVLVIAPILGCLCKITDTLGSKDADAEAVYELRREIERERQS